MKTRYPNALWQPLPENSTQTRIRPVQVILHTIVGSAAGAIRVMQGDQTPGESHLVSPFRGQMNQLMDLDRRADCNWKVNAWVTPIDLQLEDGVVVKAGTVCGAISIETEDDGTPEDTPWNANQLEHFADFLTFARTELQIPLHRCPDPFLPGVGYHSMFGFNRLASWDPHLTAGPYGSFIDARGRKVNVWNPWTNTVGKSCPGPARIAQFDGIVAEATRRLAPPAPVESRLRPGDAPTPLTSGGATHVDHRRFEEEHVRPSPLGVGRRVSLRLLRSEADYQRLARTSERRVVEAPPAVRHARVPVLDGTGRARRVRLRRLIEDARADHLRQPAGMAGRDRSVPHADGHGRAPRTRSPARPP
jgi:hypothetical protein